MPGTVKTTRLRKVQCAGCGYVARVSRTWLATGLPGCPCGGRLIPTDLDDVLAALEAGYVVEADLDTHAEYVTYQRGVASALHGQAAVGLKWGSDHLRSPDEIALVKVRAARDLIAHEARHAALRAHAYGGAKTSEPMPF